MPWACAAGVTVVALNQEAVILHLLAHKATCKRGHATPQVGHGRLGTARLVARQLLVTACAMLLDVLLFG